MGTLLGISILYYFSSTVSEDVKLEELALGDETSVSFASVDGVQVHCEHLNDAFKCLEGYKNNQAKEVVIWLGNSQLHSINQMKKNDASAASTLHQKLKDNSKYVITFSQPNAGLQEHYVLFEYLNEQLPISTLILPIVFDDMRETGIRHGLKAALKDAGVAERLIKTKVGKVLMESHSEQDSAGNDMSALEDTVQEKSEKYLNSSLNSFWSIWENRSKLRGELLVSVYKFRNWVFGINPSSTRKVIPGRYAMNRQALKAVLSTAQKNHVKVLLYIVPIRQDVKIPYELSQYNSFKKEVARIAEQFDTRFVNLETLVPAEYWGTKVSTTVGGGQELDFMHFQAEGHHLLSDALYKELNHLWNSSSQ